MIEMVATLSSLFPIFILILMGFGFKKICFRSNEFWFGLENLIYFVFFPALIVDGLQKASLEQTDAVSMPLALILPTLIVSAVVFISRIFYGNGSSFASVFMGAIRFNTYVGLAAAATLYGENELVMAALVIAWSPLSMHSVS